MRILLLSALFYIFSSYSAFSQDLIQNGSFKDGVNNWQILLETPTHPIKAQVIEHSEYYDLYGLADNYINTSFVELDSKSAIQQNVSTSKSDYFNLTFAYAHRPSAGDKQLVIIANQEVIYTETIKNSSTAGIFKYKTVFFKASKENTKLSFYAVSLNGPEDKGVLLTDISCEKTVSATLDINQSKQKR